jgi:hypothetical protein
MKQSDQDRTYFDERPHSCVEFLRQAVDFYNTQAARASFSTESTQRSRLTIDTFAAPISDTPLPALLRDCASLNILMFNDGEWIEERTKAQQNACQHWPQQLRRPVVSSWAPVSAFPPYDA